MQEASGGRLFAVRYILIALALREFQMRMKTARIRRTQAWASPPFRRPDTVAGQVQPSSLRGDMGAPERLADGTLARTRPMDWRRTVSVVPTARPICPLQGVGRLRGWFASSQCGRGGASPCRLRARESPACVRA